MTNKRVHYNSKATAAILLQDDGALHLNQQEHGYLVTHDYLKQGVKNKMTNNASLQWNLLDA
jgi:hypothetical protein